MRSTVKHWLAVSLLGLHAIAGNAIAADLLDMNVGSPSASGAVTGSAGTSGSRDESKKLVKCDRSFGKIAVYEPQDAYQQVLMRFNLPSPSGLLRLMIQQSGCFVVVERGQAMNILMQERQLARGGDSRQDSNMGGSQLVAADFVLTPAVQFSQQNSAGMGGALMGLGGFLGPLGMIAGAVASGLQFKQAQTTLVLADTRAGVQLAAAQGSSEKADLSIGVLGVGGGGLGALGAYGSTAEGKVVAAAFMDAYNNMISTIRDSPDIARSASSAREESERVAKSIADKSATGLQGSIVKPKLSRATVYDEPSDAGNRAAYLTGESLGIADGREKDGFIFVKGDGFKGWVDRTMIRLTQE